MRESKGNGELESSFPRTRNRSELKNIKYLQEDVLCEREYEGKEHENVNFVSQRRVVLMNVDLGVAETMIKSQNRMY